MQLQSTEIQAKIDHLNQLIQQGATDAQLNLWEMQRKELQDQFQVALAEEAQQQERIQAQAEAVESITLPLDFNDLLDNPLANEMIVEVVKQFQLQAYEEHNVEVARINAAHAEMLGILTQAGTDNAARYREERKSLEEDIQSLKNDLEGEQSMYKDLEVKNSELRELAYKSDLDKKDAETTRDNAVRISEEATAAAELLRKENAELKEQIEGLKQELNTKKALTVSGNEKLAELAAKAKESTAAAAQRGIDRWNQQYGMDIPVLEVPEIQPVNAVTETDEAAEIQPFPDQVQATDSGADTEATGNENMEPMVGQPEQESEVITLESLHAEVNAIKIHLGLVA